MDEPTAWLYQAMADRQAAERFVADEVGTGRCHAIAKWQQTVEKAVKALVSALHDAGGYWVPAFSPGTRSNDTYVR